MTTYGLKKELQGTILMSLEQAIKVNEKRRGADISMSFEEQELKIED